MRGVVTIILQASGVIVLKDTPQVIVFMTLGIGPGGKPEFSNAVDVTLCGCNSFCSMPAKTLRHALYGAI